MTTGPPSIDGATPTAQLVAHIADGTIRLPCLSRAIPDCTLEELRFATDATSTATSGLVVILELHRRIAGRSDPGWQSTAGVQSAWQPSLLQVMAGLSGHLRDDPTIGDTMWWLVDRFVVAVHERIAYSKLQQREHTFRFRWENGQVRFYNNGIGRFPLAAIRNEPLASLTYDLGFWKRDGAHKASLTERGRTFSLEMLA